MTNYYLWEVILNGDSPTTTRVIDGVVQAVAPTIAEQKLAKKNELKARGTLLMALPDTHQLKFNIHKDAKSLMEAIEKRYQSEILEKLAIRVENLHSADLEDQSLDDLFHNLKIYKAEVKISAVPSVSAASTKVPSSALPNVDNLSDAVIYSFFASQSNSPQLDNEDLKQIDADDLEETDLKRIAKTTIKEVILQRRAGHLGTPGIKTPKEELFQWRLQLPMLWCHSMMELVAMIRAFRMMKNQRIMPSWHLPHQAHQVLIMRKSQFDVFSNNSGPESVEAKLVVYQQNENVFEEYIKLLKFDVMLRDNALVKLRKKFEKAEKERDELNHTLYKFQTSLKNLSKLLESQITDKTGLGYDTQVFNSHVIDSNELTSFESDVSVPTSPVRDRYKSGEGYHVVHPSYTGTFMPHKPYLVFHNAPTASETVPNVFNVEPRTPKPNKDLSQSNRSSTPIIEDWVSNSEDESEGEPIPTQKAPSFVQSTKHVKTPRTFVKSVEHPNQDKNLRKDILKSREINGGYVAFDGNPKGGKITGKGKIKTGKLDFDDVYFVKELKFNLCSVSQMCDKKNSILFIDTECVVLCSNFKLDDVLLRVPKENNMYNVDLKNIIPSGDFTCLFAKATLDESNIYHRRLGHINFKTMNKLVKGNLVRGLPSRVFENNHTCVACKKGKQHKASCKIKPVSFVSHPLQRLHMDLFGPTFVKSLTKKSYCLVVIDDYSRTPSIGFMRPVGCPVTILNTLDPLGKFDRKADEGFLVGYSVSSKAFIVFNSRNIIVHEILHINFLKNQPNVAGSGPKWLFGIDTLTQSMNYQSVAARNQLNSSVGIQGNFDAGVRNLSDEFEDFSSKSTNRVNATSAIVTAVGTNLTNSTNSFIDASPSDNAVSPNFEIGRKSSFMDPSQYPDDLNIPALEDIVYSDDEEDVGTEADFSNLKTSIIVSLIPTTRVHKDHPVTQIISDLTSAPQTRNPSWIEAMQEELLQFKMQKVWVLVDLPKGKRAIGSKWIFRNKKDERGIVIRNKAQLVTQGYTQEEGIDYEEVFAPVERIKAIWLFLAYASFMGFMIYQMDVKSSILYETIEEEVHVCQPPGFEDPDYLDKVYKVVKALYGLHQAPRAWPTLVPLVPIETQQHIFNESPLLGVNTLRCDEDSLQLKELMVFLVPSCMVRNIDSPSKFLMYLRFLQVMINAQVDDLSSFNNKYTSPTLTQKVFANMRRIVKGFLGVETPLFDSMLVQQQVHDDVAEVEEDEDDNETYTTLTQKVANLEQNKIAQALKITKLKQRVRKLEKKRKFKSSGLKRLKKDTDEAKPAEVEEVLKVVTAAKLITEVVTTVAPITTIAQVPKASALRRRRGVVIQDPEETPATSVIVHSEVQSKDKGKRILIEETKPLKGQAQIDMDEAFAR
nr:putative ribonuclease H-like domain-containing protein [Tanacetum cinerariifolium]